MVKASQKRASRKRASQKIDTVGTVALDRLKGCGAGTGPIVRVLSQGSADDRPTEPGQRAFRSTQGRAAALLVYGAVFLTLGLGVVLGPPVFTCGQRASVGFFSGETLSGCIGAATSERLKRLESQLNMIVRGSGR